MELFLGILAAWGGVMLVWTVLGIFLMPLTRRKDIRITAVIRSTGEGGYLEQYIRGLMWLRDLGPAWWDIAVLEDDLSQEACDRAQRLTEKECNSAVLSAEELLDWMER